MSVAEGGRGTTTQPEERPRTRLNVYDGAKVEQKRWRCERMKTKELCLYASVMLCAGLCIPGVYPGCMWSTGLHVCLCMCVSICM